MPEEFGTPRTPYCLLYANKLTRSLLRPAISQRLRERCWEGERLRTQFIILPLISRDYHTKIDCLTLSFYRQSTILSECLFSGGVQFFLLYSEKVWHFNNYISNRNSEKVKLYSALEEMLSRYVHYVRKSFLSSILCTVRNCIFNCNCNCIRNWIAHSSFNSTRYHLSENFSRVACIYFIWVANLFSMVLRGRNKIGVTTYSPINMVSEYRITSICPPSSN